MSNLISESDLDRLRITKHGYEAMVSRHVALCDLADVLLDPHITEPHEGKVRFIRGDLVAVCAFEPDPVLITVLLRRREAWSNEDARSRRTA